MEWTLRLVGTEIDGQSRSCEVMAISRPDGLGDIASLGLTLAEAKQLLVQVQQEVVAASSPAHAVSAGLSVVQREVPPQGLADAPDCDAVWRGQCEASPAGVCGQRLWRDRERLAIALPVNP
jgi:hypothetical protein